MINFLRNIESNYNVNDIKVNGATIWGVLRTSFYVRYGNKHRFSRILNFEITCSRVQLSKTKRKRSDIFRDKT